MADDSETPIYPDGKEPPAQPPQEIEPRRPPGRPRLTEEEKVARAAQRAESRAANAGVPGEISAKYAVKPKASKPAEVVKPPPTPEQIAKVNRALQKTFAFLGEMVYEVFSDPDKGIVLVFKEQKAKDLADAWEEIIAESMGENAGDVIRWTTAVCSSGYIIMQSVREVREAQAKAKVKK